MLFSEANRLSAGGRAINWAVNSFVLVLLLAIVLGLLETPAISFSKGLVIVGAFAIALHALTICVFYRSTKWRVNATVNDGGAVKALEYTISIVCWVLQGVLWWYDALEAAWVFLFIPTYFVTSLLVFHSSFEFFLNRKISRKRLFLLAGNFWTLGHSIVILLRVRESAGGK
jgi:hypothetical protein